MDLLADRNGTLGAVEGDRPYGDAALREGGRYRWPRQEGPLYEVDRIGKVVEPVPVHVSRATANRRRPPPHEFVDAPDRIGQIDLSVGVRIAPHERIAQRYPSDLERKETRWLHGPTRHGQHIRYRLAGTLKAVLKSDCRLV